MDFEWGTEIQLWVRSELSDQPAGLPFPLVEINDRPYAVIDIGETTFRAVPLDPDKIFTLPESHFEDRMTQGYHGTPNLEDAAEFPILSK